MVRSAFASGSTSRARETVGAKSLQVAGCTDKEMREARLLKRRQKKAEAATAVSPLPAEAFSCGEIDSAETPNAECGPAPWNGKAYIGTQAIGRKVRVYWKDDDDWFPGIVAAYDATRLERRYLCFYDDCALCLRFSRHNRLFSNCILLKNR